MPSEAWIPVGYVSAVLIGLGVAVLVCYLIFRGR